MLDPGFKRKAVNLLKVGLAVSLCVYLTSLLDWDQLATIGSRALPIPFAGAVLVCLVDKAVMGGKWQILLKAFGVQVPMSVPVFASLRSKVFQFFTPSCIGEDVYKTYFVARHGQPLRKIVFSVLVERSIGAVSSLAIISLLLSFSLGRVLHWPIAALAGTGVSGFLLISVVVWFLPAWGYWVAERAGVLALKGRLASKIRGVLSASAELRESAGAIFVYYLVSVGEKMAYGTAIYLCARSVGLAEVEYWYIVASTPLLALLERLPISVSAIGVREGLFVGLFSPLGLEPTAAITVALALRAAEVGMTLLCLPVWFFDSSDERVRESQLDGVVAEIQEVEARVGR